MSRWSPVYVPYIETGGHVKNNACTVEIKIKWMIRKDTEIWLKVILNTITRSLTDQMSNQSYPRKHLS
jgi:hypothetical protein